MYDRAVQKVIKCAWQYKQGYFCPAVLREFLVDALAGQDTVSVLEAVPAEFQELLRAAYHDRPLSLGNERSNPKVLRAIEDWCLGIHDRSSQ